MTDNTPHYFFCFGLAKSGTTLLQRSLDLHPEVSCPSEHKFDHLYNRLARLIGEYNEQLKIWDRQTGAQGPTLLQEETLIRTFRALVLEIMASTGNTKVRGINDNAVLNHLEKYDQMFEHPTMIAIFRHPIDVAVSAWHRAQQLSRQENDPSHREHVEQFGGLDAYVLATLDLWKRQLTNYLSLSETRPNFLLIKYEDLVSNKEATLRQLFSSLNVDTSLDCLTNIVAATEFSHMKSNSSEPGFFRSGQIGSGVEAVSASIRQKGRDMLGDLLPKMDYTID